jgi:hypothetical protein
VRKLMSECCYTQVSMFVRAEPRIIFE